MSHLDRHDTGEARDAALLGYLSRLPAPAATPALWARIDATRVRRRRRRQLLGAGATLGAVAMLAWLVLPYAGHDSGSRIAAAAPAAPAVPAVPVDLRIIDRQLQAAYDNAADPERIDALWQQRALATTPIEQENPHHDAILRL